MFKKQALIVQAVVLATSLLAWGCGGGVDVYEHPGALKLLDLSPRMGETGVALAPDVVAVFSAGVTIGPGETHLGEETFFVEDEQGDRPTATVEISEMDEQGATAVLRLDQDLEMGWSYTVVIRETIKGRYEEGGVVSLSDPLGVEIRSFFIVTV